MMRWLLLALVTACTSFDAVPRNTCGNGILEPGEDCDSPAASCVRCAVTCQTAMDCPTTDYTCGVDGFCHAPGGAFGPPVAAGAFLVDDYQITDVDRDRIGDVVGMSKTSIVVRHGDATASLAKTESQITPSQTGPAAFGDLDGDGSLDLTIATPGGLVSYASPYGTLSPLDVRSTVTDQMGNPVDIRMGFPITQLGLGVFVVTQNQVLFAVLDFSSLNSIVAALPCQQTTPDQFSTALVDVYKVNKPGDIAIDTVVAMTTVGGGKLCVLAVHKDTILSTATITNITPANPPTLTKKPVLADLDNDNDRCPDLVTTEGGAHALRHWSGIMAPLNTHCTLQASLNTNGDALPSISGAPANVDAIGRAAIDPPQAGAAPDALVLSDSIWGFGGTAWGLVYQSTRKLASVTNADLDGDGLIDIVLSAAGSDDLDVLYRATAALAIYQLYRVDTASVVTSVAIADFDGDGFNDIEYTESLTDHERMMVAYGTSDRVLPPIEVGTFKGIVSVAPVSLFSDPLLQISDLLVLQPPDMPGGAPALTFLSGSPQRIMIPYFDPRDNTQKGSLFRAVMVGNFAPTPGGGAPHNDLVALATGGSAAMTQLRAWLVPGTASGLDGATSPGLAVNGITDCSLGGTGFCYEQGTYLAWPVSSTQDVVIGVDRAPQPHAGYVDPRTATSTTLSASDAPMLAQAIPAGNTIRTLYSADVDGDGKLDLVAAFEPADTGSGALLVCQVDANGLPQQCSDLEPTIKAAQPTTTACFDAAPGHFGYSDPTTPASTGSDLVALCHDDGATLYRIHHEADGYHADVLAHSTSPLASLRVGDINGDGIDDVVAVAGERGAQSLLVFPQCSSRTLATCQLGAGGNP
jgi:hypothetical protein